MADWPSTQFLPTGGVICNTTSLASGHGAFATGVQPSAGAVWPAANRAIFSAFSVETTVTAQQMIIIVSVQSGNLDLGIYDVNGVRLVSMGSTAVAAAGVQLLNIADTVLAPGTYYMAMCVDNTTASFNRAGSPDIQTLRTCGVHQQAVGAVTLPNPATFANPASPYVPGIGVATVATV